jgi:hypothetical protein
LFKVRGGGEERMKRRGEDEGRGGEERGEEGERSRRKEKEGGMREHTLTKERDRDTK